MSSMIKRQITIKAEGAAASLKDIHLHEQFIESAATEYSCAWIKGKCINVKGTEVSLMCTWSFKKIICIR